MDSELYSRFFKGADLEKVIDTFHETIVDTNRGYKFFVDWKKIKEHVEKHKIEFNILNSLIGSRDFDNNLRKILTKYPETLPTIPILIALRQYNLKVIKDFIDDDSDVAKYDFKERKLSEEEIEKFVAFFAQTGLKFFFQNLSTQSIQDYVTGVEVGMDTHARKNRSGDAMELAIKPIIDEIIESKDIPLRMFFQKKFNYLENKGISVPSTLKDRKADYILVKNDKKIINIEVNFYSGTGSKPQEIVDSYINRQNELKENSCYFIWVTDGYGWEGQKNQIKKGFEKVDYLLNLHFARRGFLKEILWKI